MSNGMFTVMGFTIRNKFRSKAFLVTSIIIALLISIVINLPYIISLFQSDKATNIGVISKETALVGKLEQFFAAQEKPDILIKSYPDQGSNEANEDFLKDKISEGEIKGYLEFGAVDAAMGFPKVAYKSKATMDFGLTGKLQTGLQFVKTGEVAKGLLTDEQLALILAPVPVQNVQISTTEGGAGSVGDGKTAEEVGAATMAVYALIVLLFTSIMITGNMIATEITAEKSSRIMEVLVTSVSPTKQMFGKIFGMLIVGISQIALLVVVAVINFSMPHNINALKDLDIDINDIEPSLYIYALVFYVLGYFLYATLYSAIGSIVSRTEELGQAVMPITFVSMAGFYTAFYGVYQPNASFVVVTSFIPLFTPFVMFLRVGLADPAAWEVWLSIGLLLGSTLLLGWLSAKIYRTGVLMYGKRPSFKELRKAMKAFDA